MKLKMTSNRYDNLTKNKIYEIKGNLDNFYTIKDDWGNICHIGKCLVDLECELIDSWIYKCLCDNDPSLTKDNYYQLRETDTNYHFVDDKGYERWITRSDFEFLFEPVGIDEVDTIEFWQKRIEKSLGLDKRDGFAKKEVEFRKKEIEKDLRLCRIEERLGILEDSSSLTNKKEIGRLPKLKAVEIEGESCNGCYFKNHSYFCENIKCDAEERSDGENVIFVEVKE